jgi:hypothetical protein
MFESLRQYRRIAGLLLIDFMKYYVPLNKITKILDPKMKPIAQALKQLDPDMIDIIVSEAPQSENNKNVTWAFFMQIFPMLMKMGIPLPPNILDYSPLPATMIEEWKRVLEPAMAQRQQQQQQPQQQGPGGQQQPPQGQGGIPPQMLQQMMMRGR